MPSPKTVAQLGRLQHFGFVHLKPSGRASPAAAPDLNFSVEMPTTGGF